MKLYHFNKTDLFQNKNGIEWKEKNKELVVNGVYHEVLKITETKSGVNVFVIEDKAENSLFKKYFSLNNRTKSHGASLIKQILNLNYLNPQALQKLNAVEHTIQYKKDEFLFIIEEYGLKTIKPPQSSQLPLI